MSRYKSGVPRPSFFDRPARDLNESQARDCVEHLLSQAEIELYDKFYGDPPTLPPVTPTYTGLYAGIRVNRLINGVQFVNVTSEGSTSVPFVGGPGWRMLLTAHRLAAILKKEYGAGDGDSGITVYHLGFKGRGAPDDRHNKGLDLDFAGAQTVWGTWMVLKHWGQRSVPDAKGGVKGVWPALTNSTRFRLDADMSGVDAYDFFMIVYNFAIAECRDGSTVRSKSASSFVPNLIEPARDGFVLHPDHGNTAIRNQHTDHIHMDVGD